MSRSNLVVAIDIGSSKIATLVGQYFAEEERLNIIGVANFPARGIRKGQIINIEEATESLIESVEAAERMAGFSISEAFVGIAAPHIESINSQGVVAIADAKGEIVSDDVERVIEAAKAVSLPSSRQILHVIPRQFTVDGQGGVVDPVGMTGVRLEVEAHIVTASAPALKNLTKCIDEAGVSPLAFVFSGFAAAEAVLTPTERELGVVLVDIGAGVTSLTIYNEGAPCYSAVLPVGAQNITNDLAIGLRLSLEEAEKLKLALARLRRSENGDFDQDEISLKKLGVSDDSKRKVSLKTAIDGIIAPRVNEIFSLVAEEIKESGFGGATPSGVVLTGGGAETIDIKYACQRILGLPVRIGRPEKVGGIVDDVLRPSFASSLGLILYGIKQQRFQKVSAYKSIDFVKIAQRFKSPNLPIRGAWQRVVELLKPLLP